MEYVNIFQGDFIMGLSLFNLAKGLFGAAASQQPIQKTEAEAEQKPETQVNAAIITPPEQLRATANSISQAITPEIIQNPEAPLAINQEKTSPGFQVTISQETMNNLQPILSKAVNTLKAILPFIEEGIKTILPQSAFDKIFSESIQNNGGSEAVRQQLETNFKNTLNRAMTKPQINANPA